MPKYEKLPDPLALEDAVLKFWEQAIIPEKSLQRNEKSRAHKRFVFYEGPPTANDRPHYGHLIPRVYKDLFPRYKLMQGYHVVKKGGWDTHGLPVELKVEKELGLNSKREIEAFGVEAFVQRCRENVWKHKNDWVDFDPRMGFWYDQENAYITYTNEYIESVWWALKKIWEKGLLYKGHKVLPYCPRCGTPLSSHEVAQGYETVKDPSIFFKLQASHAAQASLDVHLRELRSTFVLPPQAARYTVQAEPGGEGEQSRRSLADGVWFLVWTTTPWTVPSNVALAVGPKFTYAKVKVGHEIFILARDLVESVIKEPHEIIETLMGAELVGWRYEPAYKLSDDPNAYRVVAADFVSLEDGTGIVHIAPAFGEEDYHVGQAEKLPFVNPVDLDGKFTREFPLAAGQFVKDADAVIMQDLKERRVLYKSGKYEHEYPFCWRCKTPLLYYALDSYFIQTTAKQHAIIENNREIQWHPEHFREGRFGNFLETMKDWALSRDRYWGTPLPLWVCERCGQDHCVGSRQELVDLALDQEEARAVEFHRPWIDDVLLKCSCGGTMRRVPYVIDCWFDSGMMHTAQWHYPFENQEIFAEQFPADFIAEGIDQTRGWFYSLLVTSTLLYEEKPYPHPYKHVIVTGMGLDETGKKMSKSLGNVLDPWDVVNVYGADAVRWFFYAGSAPWRDRRLDPQDIIETRGVLETVRNVYSFFALYAGIDRFDPTKHITSQRVLLDRWILSRLQHTISQTTKALDEYDPVAATQAIAAFVDELSNWYVRNSRARFWGSEWTDDKTSAFATLYEVLLALTKLLAPFVPFLAEAIYQNLRTDEMPESVHLCDWPQVNEQLRDIRLEDDMKSVRQIVTAGLQARNKAHIKVRQPLRKAVFYLRKGSPSEEQRIIQTYGELIRSELNVKEIEAENLVSNWHKYGQKILNLNKSKLGPKFGKLLPKIEQAVNHLQQSGAIVGDELLLKIDGQVIKLTQSEGEYGESFHPHEGFMDGHEGDATVILYTQIDDALRQEGLAREFVRLVQECRKEAGFEVSDRIELLYEADPEVLVAIEKFAAYVQEETLAVTLQRNSSFEMVEFTKELDVNGRKAKIGLVRKR